VRATGRFIVCVIAALAGWPPASAHSPESSGADVYGPPVDAAITDTFRPPATPYGAGNRGVDYATTEGQPVNAAADGEVVFAGRIGASSHVTILHPDGLRTSYSFLATTTVRRGQRVRQGQPLGTAGPAGLHFGARAGNNAYVDPLILLGQVEGPAQARAWLVDDPDPTKPLTEHEERNLVIEQLRGLVDQATKTIDDLADHTIEQVQRKIELARILADDAIDLGLPMPVVLALAAQQWQAIQDQHRCTPATTPIPTEHTRQRRIVILVGGLGSATGNAAVLETDTHTLGYAPNDVHQFSYADEPTEPYGPRDTQGDIGDQGKKLAAQIDDLHRRHPGTPVDVIAHSQGGLVARAAITVHHAQPSTLATLGTPHQGTDLATAGAGVDATNTGHLVLEGVTLATDHVAGLDLNSTSIQQMAETSHFITHLPEQGWDPAKTHVVSIVARADPVVPNHQAAIHTTDAYNTVVTPHGTSTLEDHSTLPGSPEATAEIARALNRQPPTCRTLQRTLGDTFVGHELSNAHDSVGAALAAAGLYGDYRTKQLVTTRLRR
jgi:murein DD-endopeptidase MepM/ murein hydrolase activator NlpD